MLIQGYNPAVSAPVTGQTANAASAASSSSSSTSPTNLGATFLNLLVTELQNQDPTSPVDPTQMVGQMVSLNQLDQLIAMNQTLTQMLNSGQTTKSGTTQAAGSSNRASGVAALSGGAAAPFQSTAAAQFVQQPAGSGVVGGGSLMNLYGNMAPSASSLASNLSGVK